MSEDKKDEEVIDEEGYGQCNGCQTCQLCVTCQAYDPTEFKGRFFPASVEAFLKHERWRNLTSFFKYILFFKWIKFK